MSSFWSRVGAAGALAFGLVAFPAGRAAAAGPTVIKMATLAPEGSSWYKVLQTMGEGWKKATNGAVTVCRRYRVTSPAAGGVAAGPNGSPAHEHHAQARHGAARAGRDLFLQWDEVTM